MRFFAGLCLAIIAIQTLLFYFFYTQGILRQIDIPIITTILFGISVVMAVSKLEAIRDANTFTVAYLGVIVLQILAWISYLAVILYLDENNRKENTIIFLSNTLIFIFLQTFFLFKKRSNV